MAGQKAKDNKVEIGSSSVQEIKQEQYHKLNIAFCLMSIIPFLVFFYLLVTRLFSINIVIGDVGLALFICIVLSLIGYGVGYSIVQNLLNKVINYMERTKLAYIELKETQELLIQAEKFKAIGQLASGVAHEVRNPLGIILQGVEYLEMSVSPKEKTTLDALSKIKDGVRRADTIIASLYDFSRTPKLNIYPEDINSALEQSVSSVENKYLAKHIHIIREMKNGLPRVLVDKDKIGQVFINVLTNAIEALPEEGVIVIRSFDKQLEDKLNKVGDRRDDYFRSRERVVIVEIEDTGAGISEQNITKVFNPFFTTKEIGKGVGLGLFISRGIVIMHRGMMDIESKLGKGTKIIVTLHIEEENKR